MNYIEQIVLFGDYAEEYAFHAFTQAIWYQLMRANNKLMWSEEFSVDNKRLRDLTGIGTERSLIKYRQPLVDSGLIEYEKGTQGSPNIYRINELYREDEQIKVRRRTDEIVEQVKVEPVDEPVQETMTEIVSETKQTQTPKKKPKAKKKEDTQKYLDVMEFYMEHRRNMKSIQFKDGPIKTRIKALKKLERAGFSLDDAREAILKAEQSDFLNGLTGNDWVAGFDWIIKPDKITKILEGTYENRQGQKVPTMDDYLYAVGSGQINMDGSIKQDEFTDFVIDDDILFDGMEEYIS